MRSATSRRRKKLGISRRDEWLTLSFMLAVVAIPVLGGISIITLSSKPSFHFRTFATEADDPPVLDWLTLDRLSAGERQTVDRWAVRLHAPVRLPGYMISYDELPDRDGKVSRFLLVPDAGNWLHAPHRFDSAEVVVVTLKNGKRLKFQERVPVWVRGELSVNRITTSAVDAEFVLAADDVAEMDQKRP
jgi:hypothetical protein